MIFLQFHGKFRFQVPYYNNFSERNSLIDDSVRFQPLNEPSTLREKIVGDFRDYFKFEFLDVKIKRIVRDSNVFAEELPEVNEDHDIMLDSNILFEGFLVDVSPHMPYGRLYPIVDDEDKIDYQSFGIKKQNGNTILSSIPSSINTMTQWSALQSDIHTNIRSPAFHSTKLDKRFRMSGNFTSVLTSARFPSGDPIFSESIIENSEKNLHLFFQLSKFDFNSTVGEIIGYIGMHSSIEDSMGRIRYKDRRIVLTPEIDSLEYDTIRRDFLLEGRDFLLEGWNNSNAEAKYDILEKERLVILRYLDFVLLVTHNNDIYEPPSGYQYQVYIRQNGTRIPLGSEFEITGTTILESGGIIVLKIPDGINIQIDFALEIDVTKDNVSKTLMVEPEIDFEVVNDVDRGIVMYSGEEKTVVMRAYRNNHPQPNQRVELSWETENLKSPIVAWFKQSFTDSLDDGTIIAKVNSANLENVTHRLFNPVDGNYYGPEEDRKFLPWDQYYGNYLYAELKNKLGETLRTITIPVRVIHKVPFDPSSIPLSAINFREHIHPLFQYYLRYYPWLHVIYDSDDKIYKKPFDLDVEFKVKNKINTMIDRLEMSITSKKKMPRSRDFPMGGIEMIKRWKESLL